MTIHRWAIRAVSILVAALSFFTGFHLAISAPVRIDDAIFAELKDHSSLTIIADAEPSLSLSFDKKARRLTVRFIQATGTEILEDLEYADRFIESVMAKKDETTGDTLLEITFKQASMTFQRASATDQPGLMLSFRPVATPLRVAGVTPERLIGQRRTADRPRAGEASTEAKAPVEPEPAAAKAPERLNAKKARQTQTDKKYEAMKKFAGRESYINFMKHMQREEYGEALAAAREFLALYPKSIYRERVYFARAEIAYILAKKETSRIADAITLYNEAIATFPDSPRVERALMRKGSLYLGQEFYIEALTEFGGLLRMAPKGKYNVAAMLARARIFMKQKKFNKSYNELERILILFPGRREARSVKYLIAQSYFGRGMYAIANTIFDEAVAQWPTYPKTHPETFLMIAETKYKMGDIHGAMRDWFTIVNLFPASFEARTSMLRIGDAYIEHNQKKDAAEIFERVVTRYPKNDESVMARLRLASLGAEDPQLLKTSRIFDYSAFERPYKTFEDVLKNYPPQKFGQDTLMRKGKAYAASKRYISSIIAFKELLRTFPQSRMSDEVFGLIRENFVRMIDLFHRQEGFFTALMVYYDNFDPFLREITDPAILVKIAESYGHMTLYDRAIEYYRLANSRDEAKRFLPRTAFGIAEATFHRKYYSKAERLLRRYMKDFPRTSHAITARHLLGDTLDGLGRAAEAATEWRLASEADRGHPRVPRTSYNLANNFRNAGQYLMAVDAYNRAIDSFRPAVDTGEPPPYIKDSFFALAETFYLDQDYPNTIREAEAAKRRFPDDERAVWMDYLISSSFERINKDEAAVARFRDISKKEDAGAIGRVAAAKVKTHEWKRKNNLLFLD